MQNEITVDKDRKADFSMDIGFPVQLYVTDLSRKPDGCNNWHWHEEIQFCLVLEGTLEITVQDNCYKLKEQEGIFINVGLMHKTRSLSGNTGKYLCLNVHPKILSFFSGNILQRKYIDPYLGKSEFETVLLNSAELWQQEILCKMSEIYNIWKKKEWTYELEMYLKILYMWKILIQNIKPVEKNVFSVFRHNEVKEILNYLQTHYKEKITLDDIAETVHLSKSSCCRIFREAFDSTIFEYLTEFRIQQSLQLLLKSDCSVTEVAMESGFSDESYFIKKFQRIMHMTPGVYRKSGKGVLL